MRLLKRVKIAFLTFALTHLLTLSRYLSNRNLVHLTFLAERVLAYPDPVVKKAIKEIRRYFQEGHPCVELVRRLLRELNPSCKKKLVQNFFVNAIFKGVAKSKEFADKYGFTPPWFLVLSPTMRCNLNCLGCSTRIYRKDEDMSVKLINRILQEARDMGIHFIVTQGGEMFMYEEMLDVYRDNTDIYFQVYTNGTLIDKKMAHTLARLGNVAPMVSLEGFQETTDARRGQGVFKKAMQAMDNLKERGLFFGASVTQTRYNTDEILSDEFFDLLIKKGCFVVWFFQILPIGKNPDTELMATPQQRHRLWQKVAQIRGRLPIFIGDFWNDGPFVGGCIAAGRRFIHINNQGDVEPCAFVHFAVDNIKEKSLSDTLRSDFFRFIRAHQPFGEGNLLTPCMIIDNPDILRQAVSAYGARPTAQAADLILKEPISSRIDKYAKEMHQIAAYPWQELKDKVVKWPT